MRPIQALVAGITLRQTNLTTVVTKLAYSIFLSLPPPLLFLLFTRVFFRSTKDNLSLSSKLATPLPLEAFTSSVRKQGKRGGGRSYPAYTGDVHSQINGTRLRSGVWARVCVWMHYTRGQYFPSSPQNVVVEERDERETPHIRVQYPSVHVYVHAHLPATRWYRNGIEI